jgi:type III restriction enzyme
MIIENPVLNSAYAEPTRHFKFTEQGITDEIVKGRRVSAYFMPIAAAKKKGAQASFQTTWTEDRLRENEDINRIRAAVDKWRRGGRLGITRTTKELLRYWTRPERERRLFFCQIEAIETAIFLAEVAGDYGERWIETHLREQNDEFNPGLYRLAFKMATGTGKTVIMAMLIAWQALNKLADPRSKKFTDTFLVVTPGITIRDRLRVLLPSDPESYYQQLDILPSDRRVELGRAKIVITNFHAFLRRERGEAAKLTKTILRQAETGAFTETPAQMVNRVCRELGTKKNIVVLNDEAHHCYRAKPSEDEEKIFADEKDEVKQRDEDARVWLAGLEAVQQKLGIRTIYDLSATPFFLRGSGYAEGTLFPWVVSDFSLVDAIESGIVKVPRVPVSDDSMVHDLPTYRDLWGVIRDALPKRGRSSDTSPNGEPKLPAELQGALHSLYGHYQKTYAQWQANRDANLAGGVTPPVFIVVCGNTRVSKLVYDYIAGWEKTLADDKTIVVPGALDLFSNELDGGWTGRPNTILVDSAQLESGEGMSPEFRKLAHAAIERFKDEYRARFPGRDVGSLDDEDLLREVMNTVGKAGKLGEHVRCVVSVSMLTEGWDATTVTHILGVRAFSTQLLCEQVVGRGLRRMSFATDADDRFYPEYAEVYGVPFSFIPCSGSSVDPKPGPQPTHVRALEDRVACELTFPRLVGYRYDLGTERLEANFTEDSVMTLSTEDVPTRTVMTPIAGLEEIHTLDDLRRHREQEVAFQLARLVLGHFFTGTETGPDGVKRTVEQPWLFPQLLRIAKQWLGTSVVLKDGTFKQLLLLHELAHNAAGKIHRAIARAAPGERKLLPVLRPYDEVGSTRFVAFDTRRPVYATRADRCHVNYVVADTAEWEQKVAQTLEAMPEVLAYVKNAGLNFEIPYVREGEEHAYLPDYLIRYDDGQPDPLNLVVEVTGQKKSDKEAKVETARTYWVPAVNSHGGFGRWAFVEVRDPWNAATDIRAELARLAAEAEKGTV